MKIKSFGCSFLAGTDLPSPRATWPALISQMLGVPHENHAAAGIGNLQILERVLAYARADSVNIVCWTWIDRFDFCPAANEQWQTLRPVLDHPLAEHYFRHLHGQYRDMLTTLTYINAAVDHLERNRMPYWMTTMDLLILEEINPAWHDPRAVSLLQDRVRSKINLLQSQTFLDWARQQGFAISSTLHPLDQAHLAAADLLQPVISQICNRVSS